MPRRKVDIRFIENAGARSASYATRSRGLRKKASELSVLCGVPVALVCAPAGAGTPLVWESEEGVLDTYRAAAVPPESRARHTHRSYLEAELGKRKAKLARARPGALPDWDAALNDMTPDEAREVLEIIDANLRAAGDRMVALGLPADGRLELQQVASPEDASDDDADGPRHLALDMEMDYAGFQTQMMPYHGESNDHGGLLEQFLMQPECGSSYAGPIDETQAPGGYGDNAGCSWPDLTMCNAADESWVPLGYYPNFTNGTLAPEHCSAQDDVTCGDYVDTLPLGYAMGMDENFTYPDMDSSYTAHWQAEEFQCSGSGTGQYQWYMS
jgi:hypothetical protein